MRLVTATAIWVATLAAALLTLAPARAAEPAAAEAAPAAAEPSRLSFSAGLDQPSKYVWRGQILNPDPVLQPSAGVTLNLPASTTLGLSWWGNYDLTDYHRKRDEFTEYDWTLTVATTLDRLSVSAGLIEYYFPHLGPADSDTREAFLQLALALPTPERFPTAIAAGGYYDVHRLRGTYAKLGIQSAFTLSPQWKLTGHLDLGAADRTYNEAYFGTRTTALNDLAAGLGITATIDPHTTASWGVEYSRLAPERIEDAGRSVYGDDATCWFLARLAVQF